ncbi:hypothetical protein Egran_00722 [Elaphomyces granulatus]|uniref:Uncharacterized protein n=1 Tax=Elaphomyces granulatus TaxID=519963 RepID=A0A232M507_9EURO|nr:hypothetical protein Egran_00722 [Elaphomyces granulatus]
MATLMEKFDKIKSPKLQNQHHTAVVLSAVEETLRDQKADFTPTAYFAALLALLTQAFSNPQEVVNKDLASSVVYLLDITATFVPAALLRSKFSQILSSLVPALSFPDAEAPLLRPSIGCLESLLVAQDTAAWALPATQIGPRRAIAGLLTLTIDHRPKVRRRAQEALDKVLKRPPPSPSLDHPAADMCAETALRTLNDSLSASAKNRKGRHGQFQGDHHEPVIAHSLQLIKTIASASDGWPSKKIEPLCELLMNVSRANNEYIIMAAFEIFEMIFGVMAADSSSPKLPRLLEAIQELRPAQNDSQLLPPWIAVLSRGCNVSAEVYPQDTFEKLPELFDLISSFLVSQSRNIRISAAECLVSFLAQCIPDGVIIDPSVYNEKTLEKLAKSVTGLLSVKYQIAWAEVFNVCSAMFDAFKWRSPFLTDIVKIIGELRSNESFHGKKEAEQVLGRAVAAMGPAAVLDILPLNIIQQKASQPGRVWLLPILRDHVSNTDLGHFRSEFVPLSEALYQRILEYGSAEKTIEAKIFETLVQQAWSVLPGYCELPLDLVTTFDQGFAELLSNVLYKQTELRVNVCRALQKLVESNQAILSLETEEDDFILQRRISKETARKNIAHLSTFAGNLLAVLFNVYSQTLPHYRGYILQCINAYLSITPEKELNETFLRVTSMLESSLLSEEEAAKQGKLQKGTGDQMPPTSHTLIDLVITMSIYLSRLSYGSLFSIASVVIDRESLDPQLIKKAYKLIPRLATTEVGRAALRDRSSELQSLIIATVDKTPSPARRDRLLAIQDLVAYLPTSDLHFIPSVLSEVVMGCKESNEKARTAAFDLLVHMAKRIADAERNPPGTKIRNSLVSHLSNDSPDAPATLEEFFTMVSAGLAGSTPHMVAASISALARLFFEFRTQLLSPILVDLVQTIELFLTSSNREIVRAVLGFVKVAVVGLPEDMLRPRLDSLVPNLMVWSKEHKGRLRSKVKGILDRLVRRFGAAVVEGIVNEDDRKLVVHIRKERERKKRKKKDGHEAGEDDESDGAATKAGHSTFSNEFDKAVYGSDFSSDDSDLDDASEIDVDEEGNVRRASTKKKPSKRKSGKESNQYIRELSPESNPVDLLAPNALASISTTKPSVRFLDTKHNSKKKRSTKVDIDGKLIIGDDPASADVDMAGAGPDVVKQQGSSINAYIAAVSGPDAIRRGQKGRLKFSNKKRKDDDSMDLGEDEENEVISPASKKEPQAAPRKANMSSRRGLGMPKAHGSGNGRIEKRRGGSLGTRSGRGSIRVGSRTRYRR